MSRDPRYQKLLNDKRWKLLRAEVFRRANGLCERCYQEGIEERGEPYITPGVDCHHIVPVESAKTVQEMERLAFNPANCRLLCVACHIRTHKELRSHYKENVQANKQRKRAMFMQMNDPNYVEPDERENKSLKND